MILLLWYLFKKIFLPDTFTCPILGPLVPLFWISGDASSGFKAKVGCLIFITNVMYISWDLPLVLHLANLLVVSIVEWQFKMMAQCCHLLAHSLCLESNPSHIHRSDIFTIWLMSQGLSTFWLMTPPPPFGHKHYLANVPGLEHFLANDPRHEHFLVKDPPNS